MATITINRSKQTKKAINALYDLSAEFSMRNGGRHGVIAKRHESLNDGETITLGIGFKDDKSHSDFMAHTLTAPLLDYIE